AFLCAMASRHLWSSLLGTLRAVLRPALTAILHALRVEHAANNVIPHTRKVLHAAATDQHNRVFLEVVTLARNVAADLEAVGKTDAGNLTQSGVRLFRRRRIDARANTALLRARLHCRYL